MKIKCPHCLSTDLNFLKEKCTEDNALCAEYYLCNSCGHKFVVAYDTDSNDEISKNTTDQK